MNRILLGRYRIVDALGGGGTALVHRAEVLSGGPDVAIKELRPQFAADAVLRRRFLREADIGRDLNHPNIVRCIDTGEDGGVPVLVFELVRGETLRQLLDRTGRMDRRHAWNTFVAVARALDHAHGRGVIHRDVKPANVFITDEGAKLADFGNARVVSLASMTGASLTWGTPEYVAPEVFARGRADPRSDIYSLGVLAYEMLTGRLPWSRAETLSRLTGRADSRSGLSPTGAAAHVDALIADMLSFSPGDRPASGEESVARFLGETAVAVVSKTACTGCGAVNPVDIPRCPSCGHVEVRFAHSPGGGWRLILSGLDDDARSTGVLLRLMGSLAETPAVAFKFLTGSPRLYSAAELNAGVSLPAALFTDLDEQTARSLEGLFRRNGLNVRVARSGVGPGSESPPDNVSIWGLACSTSVLGPLFGSLTGHLAVGCVIGAALAAVVCLPVLWRRKRRALRGGGLMQLRGMPATSFVADAVLGKSVTALAAVRAPEVRGLIAELASEVYRLAQRCERVPGTDRDVLARVNVAAPALIECVGRIALRLDTLDRALEPGSDGELMQALARLERGRGAPEAVLDTPSAVRRELEAALERRHAGEQERARLSAKLCHLLGRLRVVYREATSVDSAEDREARALEAASAELDAFLAPRPS